MIRPAKFAHVVFKTARRDEMRDWYCTVLGAHLVFENSMISFITFDDEHHRMAFANTGVTRDSSLDVAGLHHSAFTFAELDTLLDKFVELREKGIRPVRPINHGVTTSMYYQDPDGNYVELQIDNFPTAEESTNYMRGPEYSADPVGTLFSPDDMVEARRGGATVAELTKRGWRLPGAPDPEPTKNWASVAEPAPAART